MFPILIFFKSNKSNFIQSLKNKNVVLNPDILKRV